MEVYWLWQCYVLLGGLPGTAPCVIGKIYYRLIRLSDFSFFPYACPEWQLEIPPQDLPGLNPRKELAEG
jgi:hypothetical protein